MLILAVFPLAARAASAEQAGWRAEFFPNATLNGPHIVTRYDSAVDFDWGCGAPVAGVPADDFSVRWTRTEWFDSGTYRFYARADDGFRLWVGNQLVIDAWHDQQGGWITRDIFISGGTYPVKAEYYEHQGGAMVTLNWERLSGEGGWQAEYYSNQGLSGEAALQRTDSAIDFAWGHGSPGAGIPADHFSARWTRALGFTAGAYRFFTSSDDGIRLWVDGQLVVDAWHDQQLPNTDHGDMVLGQGLHEVKVEYFENGGEAHAHVWWQRQSPGIDGWRGEYYAHRYLSGDPALIRDDAEINFDWGDDAPVSWMPADNFSVRWTRPMNFAPGYYRLSVRSDDGVRVWVDNGLVIDKWTPMDTELHYVDGIYLGGVHQLKVEYFEGAGSARIHFWASPSGVPVPPLSGTVVVDNTDAGFVSGGSAGAWHAAAAGYGGQLLWTRNNEYARPSYNWAHWQPDLTAGRYEVFVYIPSQYASTTAARYWVKHAGGYDLRLINQSAFFDEWVSLGTYDFSGGYEYVSLSDITYEPYLSRMIAFDAVKWVQR
jgi:hypothetical protein